MSILYIFLTLASAGLTVYLMWPLFTKPTIKAWRYLLGTVTTLLVAIFGCLAFLEFVQ